MKQEKFKGISVFFILFVVSMLSYIFTSIRFFWGTILITFFLIVFISIKYQNRSELIIHYVNPFLFLHLQSYILWNLLVDNFDDDSFTEIYLNISTTAIVTFNAVYIKFLKKGTNIISQKTRRVNLIRYNIVKYISLFALLFYLYYFFSISSFSDKRSIKDFVMSHPFLKYLYALSNLFLVCVFYELIKASNDLKKQARLFMVYTSIFLLVFFIVGERELLFSLGVAFFYILFKKKRAFKILPYYVFILLIIFVGPYSQSLKSYFKNTEKISFENKSFEMKGFDDFMTTGKNSRRVYHRNKLETLERDLIISDLGNIIGLTMNSGRWFNKVYLNRGIGTTGLGFSLPLVGFLDFKYFGVFLIYFLVSLIAVVSFNEMHGNNLGLAFVIFFITLISYVQRQDLSYFLNLTIKFILVPYFFLTKVYIREIKEG